MKFIEIWGGNFSDKATWIFIWDMNSDLRNKTWGYITLKYVGILDGIGTTIHYQAFDPKDDLTTKHVKFHGEDLAYLVIKYKLMKKRNNDKKPIRLYHPNNCLQIVP